jgi:hypothetical protein
MILQGDGWWSCFWWVCGVVFGLGILTGVYWTIGKKTSTLSAEAIRNATNAGITMSTFGITLMIGLIAYLTLTANVPPSKLTYLNVGLLFLFVAAAAGLWNISSLATITTSNGTFPVSNKENVFLIVTLVIQFVSLFSVFFLLGRFDFSLAKPSSATSNSSGLNAVYLQKPRIGVETSKSQLLLVWGSPIREVQASGTDSLWYESTSAVITVCLQNDKIKEIKETAK